MHKTHKPWAISLGMHLAILIALCVSFAPLQYTDLGKSGSVVPIKVHAVSDNQVDKQFQAISDAKVAKLAAIKQQQEVQLQKQHELDMQKQHEFDIQKQHELDLQKQLVIKQAKEKALQLVAQKKQAEILAIQKAADAKKLEQQRLAQAKAQAQAKAKAEAQAKAKAEAQAKAAMIAKQKAIAEQQALVQKQALVKQKELALQKQQQELLKKLNSEQMTTDANQVGKVVAARNNAIIDKYRAQIVAKMQLNWRIPQGAKPDLNSTYLVRLAPGGVVMDVTLVQGSGLDALDLATKAAIIKSSPLPVPDDPALFDNFRSIRLTATPKGFMQSGV